MDLVPRNKVNMQNQINEFGQNYEPSNSISSINLNSITNTQIALENNLESERNYKKTNVTVTQKAGPMLNNE